MTCCLAVFSERVCPTTTYTTKRLFWNWRRRAPKSTKKMIKVLVKRLAAQESEATLHTDLYIFPLWATNQNNIKISPRGSLVVAYTLYNNKRQCYNRELSWERDEQFLLEKKPLHFSQPGHLLRGIYSGVRFCSLELSVVFLYLYCLQGKYECLVCIVRFCEIFLSISFSRDSVVKVERFLVSFL